jgi:glycerol kinase
VTVSGKYVLALDQGTTSSRAVLFGREGLPVAMAQEEFAQIFPRPGWVEHDPEDIWRSQINVVYAVLAKAGVSAGDLAAIGITNQRETTLVWERDTGRPVHNAIVWQCRRTAGTCEALQAQGLAETIRQKTGLVLDAYFSGTKAKWLLDEVPGLRERAERGEVLFGNVDSFLIWRLTGGKAHVTDYSNASRTMLFNLHTKDWDDEILAVLGIPRAMLPRVVASSGICGYSNAGLLGAEVPIAGDAGDQQAALFGQAAYAPGMAKNTYGTGCFLLMNSGERAVESKSGLLTTVAWGLPGATVVAGRAARAPAVTYALEGSVFVAGAAIQWLRDGLGIIATAAESESLARQVPDAGGVYFVPAFVGLGAPYWDMYARGAMVGLTRGTTRAHIARAALEAICYQTRDVLQAMQADSGIVLTSLRVDGGASRNDLLMQLQADILGVPVVRPKVTETTALGAAFLAGLAVGFWRDEQELAALWQADRQFLPGMASEDRERMYEGWQRAVERSRGWAR